MTKKDIATLNDILGRLTTAENFIKDSKTEVCASLLPCSTSFYNKEGKGLTPILKEAGSDLCALYVAKKKLTNFIIGKSVKNMPQTNLIN